MSSSAEKEEAGGSGAGEGEDVVVLSEMLAAEAEAEAEATAVLGNSDSERCSYDRGYVPRQALYACLSCAAGSEPSGICLACSLACHDSHRLVELYTKRRFRCDCGNQRQSSACSLRPNKEPNNPRNRYGHNFFGRYCVCDREYPEPEGAVADAQVQCIVCEDWLHTRHLEDATEERAEAVKAVDWEELVCAACAKAQPRLVFYVAPRQNLLKAQRDAEGVLQCRLPDDWRSAASSPGPLYFTDEAWRAELCGCDECTAVEELEWLKSPDDSVAAYERRGREACGGEAEQLATALTKTVPNPHSQRKLILGFNAMKDGFIDYLKTLPEGAVVSKDHVQDFFAHLNAKKPRLD